MSGCCNPRPWQPICVGCPGRLHATLFASVGNSGNPYARIDEDPDAARPVIVVHLPDVPEETQ